jgi:transposase
VTNPKPRERPVSELVEEASRELEALAETGDPVVSALDLEGVVKPLIEAVRRLDQRVVALDRVVRQLSDAHP